MGGSDSLPATLCNVQNTSATSFSVPVIVRVTMIGHVCCLSGSLSPGKVAFAIRLVVEVFSSDFFEVCSTSQNHQINPSGGSLVY